MSKKIVKLTACALVGTTVLCSGIGFRTTATGVSNVLPVAGLSLVLGEGTLPSELKYTDSENIVSFKVNYLSSISANEILNTDIPTKVPPIVKAQNEIKDTEDTEDTSAIPEKVIPELDKTEIVIDTEDSGVSENETEDTEETVSDNSVSENSVSENALTEEEKGFMSLVIAQVNDYVNVRQDSNEESEIVGKLYDKSVGNFIEEKDGWYKIKSGNCEGFVKAEYVVTGEEAIELAKQVGTRIATVTTTTLKVREKPGMEEIVLGLVPIEDELTVLEELDGWVKVSIEEGEGYVSDEFVSLSTEFVEAESKAEEEARLAKEEADREAANAAARKAMESRNNTKEKTSEGSKSTGGAKAVVPPVSGGSGTGSSVASFATQFVGNPYVYGGTSLTNGADCSGFVMSVYNNYGVSLPHSSGAQRSVGSEVGGLANAQPGDIVCYSGHVGIYIGGGQIVHASTAKTGIKISNADYRNVLSVRRIF